MKYFCLFGLIAFVLSACSGTGTPDRAAELSEAALKTVRLEQKAMASGVKLEGNPAMAESLFLKALKTSPEQVREFVATGAGPGAQDLTAFIEAVKELPEESSTDDPAAVMRALLEGGVRKNPELLDGYLAAFQMCMEIERDGTVLQDLMPFIVALGCPMTFADLGIEGGIPRVEELGREASAQVGDLPYSSSPEDFVMPLIKLDSWGGKFSGQVTLDTLAAELVAEPWFAEIRPALENFPVERIGFLGDSHMDGIHWSTAAPFPEIIRGVFRIVNPRVEVINAGRGGDDSGEALARMDRDLLEKKPQLTFVMLGGNDSRHYGRPDPAVTPKKYVENITEIVARLRSIQSGVVLMQPPQSPELSGPDLETFMAISDNLRGLPESLRRLPKPLGAGWIDVGGELRPLSAELVYARDMIHMCPAGHKLVARKILEFIAYNE